MQDAEHAPVAGLGACSSRRTSTRSSRRRSRGHLRANRRRHWGVSSGRCEPVYRCSSRSSGPVLHRRPSRRPSPRPRTRRACTRGPARPRSPRAASRHDSRQGPAAPFVIHRQLWSSAPRTTWHSTPHSRPHRHVPRQPQCRTKRPSPRRDRTQRLAPSHRRIPRRQPVAERRYCTNQDSRRNPCRRGSQAQLAP